MIGYFLHKGWRVLVFGRREKFQQTGNIHYRRWDISQGTVDVDEPVHAVVHAAAKVADWGAYDDFYTANVIGTKNVLASFPDAECFIHISSSSVYDHNQPKHMISEDFPYAPHYLNDYGKTKMLSEQAVIEHQRPNRAILRPHAIYGVGDTTILPRLLKAHRGPFLLGVGNGHNRMSITHVSNLCYAAELVTKQSFGCEIFNIVDAEPVTLHEILTNLNDYLSLHARIVYIPTGVALTTATIAERLYQLLRLDAAPVMNRYRVHNLVSEYTVDTSKARKMLGYAPSLDMRDGFAAIKHWLEHEGGWEKMNRRGAEKL